LVDHELTLETSEKALEKLATEGYDPDFGARPLRRVITNRIEDRLSDSLLSGQFKNGDLILIDYDEATEQFVFKPGNKSPEDQPEQELEVSV